MFERRREKVGEDGNETRGVEMMVELFLDADSVVFGYYGNFIDQESFFGRGNNIIGRKAFGWFTQAAETAIG